MTSPAEPPADRHGAAGANTASADQAAQALMERAQRLCVRLRGVRPRVDVDPAEQTAALAAIEGEASALDANAQQITSVTGHGLDHDRSPLEDCLDWCEWTNRLGLSQMAAEAPVAVREFLAEAAAARRRMLSEGRQPPPAEDCADALFEAATLEFESWARCPGLLQAPDAQTLLADHRSALRAMFTASLAAQQPSEAERDRWANELIDRAGVLRTTVRDVPPGLGVAQGARVEDDLAWHLQVVEHAAGARKRRLQRALNELRSLQQDRGLEHNLNQWLGPRWALRFERTALWLVALVIVLLVVRLWVDLGWLVLTDEQLLWLETTDAVACLLLLIEFFVRLCLAPDRWRWFRRHLFTQLIPAIPFGIFVYLADAQDYAWADVFRFGLVLRLPALARYFIILRPIVLLMRVAGLLTRGLDRLIRSYGPLLNRDIILYPTRAERERADEAVDPLAHQMGELWAELHARWRLVLSTAAPEARPAIAQARLASLAEHRGLRRPSSAIRRTWTLAAREIPAETLLAQMATLTPREVESELGPDLVRRLAWAVRLLSRAPIRWLPLVRSWAPRGAMRLSAAETVSVAGRNLAAVLNRWHDRLLWCADLYGTVSPSVLIDRVGSVLVRSTMPPVYRLFLFGGLYLFVLLMLNVFETLVPEFIEPLLRRFVGQTLIVLGAVCFVILAVGWWLKRIAREATDFYERAAKAQFLALTENIRARHMDRDASILYDRVIAPELALGARPAAEATLQYFVNRMRLSLLGCQVSGDSLAFDALDRCVLLYRDTLDGALLGHSDTRTTSQLLGNPALRQFQLYSTRVARKEARALSQLDLERQQALFGGPYLWFNFIAQAIAHSTARLIVEYNRHVIPCDELAAARPAEQERFRAWLVRRGQLAGAAEEGPETQAKGDERSYATTSFTALHFLDCDPERDEQVAARFGPEVLACLRRDRAQLIRRIFGTYPAARLPKQERTLNLYALYQRWFVGGRALFLPWFVLVVFARQAWALLKWIARSVAEIRTPELRSERLDAADEDFFTAIRKIHRMRGPVVEAAIRLRARMDPEFLGVPLPSLPGAEPAPAAVGAARTPRSLETSDDWLPPCDADLKFLAGDPELTVRIAHDRRRAESDMARLAALIDAGLLDRVAAELGLPAGACHTPEHVRAAAVVYLADMRGLRGYLSGREILREVLERSLREPLLPQPWRLDLGLAAIFRRYWTTVAGDLADSRDARKAAWRAIANNVWGSADALRAWHKMGEGAPAEGLRRLADLLRHPSRITEQLVTMRAVQTLALLDVLNYRVHVYALGEYEPANPHAAEMLRM